MKTISVLLTKYSDWMSNIVYFISGFGYTHASLSLDGDENCFYSFNFRSFAIETVEKHRKRGVKKSICYQIQVTDETYEKLKSQIDCFKENKGLYRYTRLGVLFASLRIPFHWENHYFCSQFVAELLTKSKEVSIKGRADTYLPNYFESDLRYCKELKQVLYNVI